ncbi:MAG: type IV pilus modification PilV family protein [Desulfovibrionales bacterium]
MKPAAEGFTLIEIIVTLVLVSFLALVLYSLQGTALTSSAQSILNSQQKLELKQEVENIVSKYARFVNAAADNTYLETFKADIETDPSVACSYITFDNGIEQPSGSQTNTLKVTVTNDEMTATMLFTRLKKSGDDVIIRY